ncbi:MAG: hypothetical protein FAF03_00715 [Epsilonproteobacteria bacterium]|nr:hypothetical protein [Campylobacterota bacterium]
MILKKITFIGLTLLLTGSLTYANEHKKETTQILKPHKKNSIEKEKKKLKHKEKKLERKVKVNAVKAVS